MVNGRSPSDYRDYVTSPAGVAGSRGAARFTSTNECQDTSKMDINPDQVIKHPFFAGVIGSAISLRWVPGRTYSEKVVIVAIGAFTAQFLGPAVGEYFSLQSPGMQSAISFLIGLFGLNMMASVSLWLKTVDIGSLFGRK